MGAESDSENPQEELHGTLPQGTRLRNYEVVSVLGQGAFGITYRARDTQLGREVAIKEYLPTSLAVRSHGSTVVPRSGDDGDTFQWGRDRFLDEARTLVTLESAPAVVRVYDFLEANGTAYMVMALVRGETLEQRVKRAGPLAGPLVEQVARKLLDGLEQVHVSRFLHRDIKPANIIVDPRGDPTLIDFGASRASMADRTSAMTAVFTPRFAAIEQMTSDEQGPWTDIYGLAVTLYFAITGKPPPTAMERILKESYVPLSTVRPAGVGQGLLRGIDAGLAVRPADRPQSVEAWRALFVDEQPSEATIVERQPRRLPSGPPPPASPPPVAAKPEPSLEAPRMPGRGRQVVLIGGGSLALIVVLAAGYLALSPRSDIDGARQPGEAAVAAEKNAQAAADAKTKAEAEAKQKVEAAAKAQTDAKAKAEADAKARADTEAKQRADAEAKAQAEAKAKAEADARQKAEDARRQAEADAKAKAEAEAKQRAEAVAKAQADAKAKAEADAKAKADTEAKQKADAEAKAQAEAKAKAEADARQKAEDARRQAEADAKQKAAADAKAKADGEAKAQAEAKAKAEADAKAKADAEAKEKAEAAAKLQTEAKAKAEAEAKEKADTEAAAKQKADEASALQKAAESSETALNLSTVDRQSIQSALTTLGFDTQGVDGTFGPRTRSMIGSWQKARIQPSTGYLSAAQKDSLLNEASLVTPRKPPVPTPVTNNGPKTQPAPSSANDTRCRSILQAAQLMGALNDADRAYLRDHCR